MRLNRRLERLETTADIKALLARRAEARRRQKEADQIVTHFGRTLDQVWPLLSEAQQEWLEPDTEDRTKKWALDEWLRSLLDGSSQLPDVSEQMLLRLLASWCDPHVYFLSFVC